MILYAFENYRTLATALRSGVAKLRAGQFRVSRFENGELWAEIAPGVTGEQCLVLGSIAPPDEQLLSASLLVRTLCKEGASEVTAVLPYLAYTRQDKDKPGQSMATPWAGALLAASGCDRIITIDVHSEKSRQLFRVPVTSLSPADLFADALRQFGLTGAALVAPDEGAIARCDAVKRAVGAISSKTPHFEKHRSATGIVHSDLKGEVGRQVVIVDDILDTGSTLVSACEKLVAAGVEEIDIMVTHGLFTGSRWQELWKHKVRRIFCTDTIPAVVQDERIVRLSIAPLLTSMVLRLLNQ